MKKWVKAGHGGIVDAAALLLLSYFIAERFPPSLLLTDTVMTGGDAASWHQIALHLKDTLIPNGRLFGWDQSNFFGYPNFQYYFIPPFLLAVLLSYAMPLTVALKLVSFAGILLLPFALYWALHKMAYPRPFPVIGAWLISWFLFHERYVMFGGNAVSTLAGEFSYSLALVLLFVFMGTLHQGMAARSWLVNNAIFLGLIGLTHAFVFLVAVLMPVYFVLRKGELSARLPNLMLLYGLAFLVMAFWVVPMLAMFDYTTPINMIWRFYSLEQFLNTINYELVALMVVLLPLLLFAGMRRYHWRFHLYMMSVAVSLYLAASLLEIADIRFFPFIILFGLLFTLDMSAAFIAMCARHRQLLESTVLLAAIMAGGAWIFNPNLQAPAWYVWNYTGYQAKPAFQDGTMTKLVDALRAPPGSPRVAWEKFAYDSDFGSDRVFESLAMFTGRWSTEGIHYASALLSKPISYMHGEYSLYSAAPEPFIFSHYNLDIVPKRFRMFNIYDFIAASPEISALFSSSEDFIKSAEAGPYTVFSLREGAGSYVESAPYHPQIVRAENVDWKEAYYAWFRRGADLDLALVAARAVGEEKDRSNFIQPTAFLDAHGFVKDAQRIPQPRARISDEYLDDFTIRFSTDQVGIGHLIKVAYSPNWKSEAGETVFPVSPGLMLIFPRTQNVTLYYQRHWSEYLGLALSAMGGVMIIMFIARPELIHRIMRLRWLVLLAQKSEYVRWPLYGLSIALILVTAIIAWEEKQAVFNDYQQGMVLMSERKPELALVRFMAAASEDNIARRDNADVPAALYAAVRALRELGRDQDAVREAERLLYYFPMWIYAHELHFHLGELYSKRGEHAQAARHFVRCAEIDLYSTYHKDCLARFASLGMEHESVHLSP